MSNFLLFYMDLRGQNFSNQATDTYKYTNTNMQRQEPPVNPNCSMYHMWETDYGRSLGGGSAWTTYWVHSDVTDDPWDYNRHMVWKYEGPVVPKTTSKDTLEILEAPVALTNRGVFNAWKSITFAKALPRDVTENIQNGLLSGDTRSAAFAVFSSWKYMVHPGKVPNTLRQRMKNKRFLRTLVKAWKLYVVKKTLKREKKKFRNKTL